jgi:pyrimidine-specific ribonucleoside hydrolase
MNLRLCLLLALSIQIVHAHAQKHKPVAVIFDTDMGPDYDDVGAIAILHAFADSGQAKILATIASTRHPNVAATLSVFNTYFKRPEIPVAVPAKGALELKDFQHWTDTVTNSYPHAIKDNEAARDATDLYREILAAQADHSVTIITVGFFTNLAALLKSTGDKHSDLDGVALVKKKVKVLVSMAGKFPAGKEFNVDRDSKSSVEVAEHWPGKIIFSGFEIGQKIHSGLPLVNNAAIKNSPVKDVFRIAIPMDKQDSAGRMSWDETAVLVGIAGYSPYYTLKQGKMPVSPDDGSNTWMDDKQGHHFHLVALQPPSVVENVINRMMMHQPVRK